MEAADDHGNPPLGEEEEEVAADDHGNPPRRGEEEEEEDLNTFHFRLLELVAYIKKKRDNPVVIPVDLSLNAHIKNSCEDARRVCAELFPEYLARSGRFRCQWIIRAYLSISDPPSRSSEVLLRVSEMNQMIMVVFANAMQDACKVKTWISYLLSVKTGTFPGKIRGKEPNTSSPPRMDQPDVDADISVLRKLEADSAHYQGIAGAYLQAMTLFETEQATLALQIESEEGHARKSLKKIEAFFNETYVFINELNHFHVLVSQAVSERPGLFQVPDVETAPPGDRGKAP